MGIINKIFSSVNGLYNNFNLITLSGVNDVIVVRRPDNTLSCSPFQLRFSKIKFYNSKSKMVHLYVNGRLTDINMTITSMGDLFFEEQKAIDNVNYSALMGCENNEILINLILADKIVEIDHRYCFKDDVCCETGDATPAIEIKVGSKNNVDEKVINSIKIDNTENNGNETETDKLIDNIKSKVKSFNIDEVENRLINNNIVDNKKITTKMNIKEEFPLYFEDDGCKTINRDKIIKSRKYKCFMKYFEEERRENMKLRIFPYKNMLKYNNNIYYTVGDQYSKINIFLNSTEHYANLLEKQKMLLFFMEAAINNRGMDEFGAEISFSSCLNNKVEKSLDDTFNKYLVREIDNPENIVVRIEGVIGRGRECMRDSHGCDTHETIFDKNQNKINFLAKNNGTEKFTKINENKGCEVNLLNMNGGRDSGIKGDSSMKNTFGTRYNDYDQKKKGGNKIIEKSNEGLLQLCVEDTKDIFCKKNNETVSYLNEGMEVMSKCKCGQVVRFYLPYRIFTKLFFEIRHSRNKISTLVKFLEYEHNRSLGWNIFWSKTPIKSDIGFSLKLDSKELELLQLKKGKNDVIFKISGQPVQLSGNIYLWDVEDKIIVTDIDGTITKSDILGHLYNFVGKDWTHNGVAELFTQIGKNNYRIIYLTARALGQSNTTRNYLKTVAQNSFTLPDGPIILSPDGLFGALYREVIAKKPEDFKIHCLQTIKELFGEVNPFFAGFGNKVSDAYTYKVLGIPNNRIYTINPEGKLLAEYTQSLVGTYHTMNEFIDSIFPNTKETCVMSDHDYSDFKWWR